MNLIYWIFPWNSFCVPYYILTCLLCQLYVAIKLITLTSRFQILRHLLFAFPDWEVGVDFFTPRFMRPSQRFFWRLAKKIAATCWAFCNLRWGYQSCFQCAAKALSTYYPCSSIDLNSILLDCWDVCTQFQLPHLGLPLSANHLKSVYKITCKRIN